MTHALRHATFAVAIAFTVLTPISIFAQATGVIAGTVTDVKQGALPGARIVVDPSNVSIVSDSQGRFALSGVTPGAYNLSISYVGFSPFTTSVTVVAGQTANVNPVLR